MVSEQRNQDDDGNRNAKDVQQNRPHCITPFSKRFLLALPLFVTATLKPFTSVLVFLSVPNAGSQGWGATFAECSLTPVLQGLEPAEGLEPPTL